MSHAWSGSFRTLLPWQREAVTRLEPRLSPDATSGDGSRSSRGTPRNTLISIISNRSHADASRTIVLNRIFLGGPMKTFRGSASVSFFRHVLVLLALLAWQGGLLAQTTLSVTPITWNVIGLDSNNVAVGPNNFPVGARVCASGGSATNVKSSFVWDDGAGVFTSSGGANAYINLRDGTLSSYTAIGINLSSGQCTDFYYEVTVNRLSSAYNMTRNYHITASADSGLTGSTLQPRQLYVEHLISQNRNGVTGVSWGTSLASLTPLAAGGTMTLVQGGFYYIQLVASTATGGYEQLESFINLPNTIFQIISVTSAWSPSSTSHPPDTTSLYADGCIWINDPNDPNYRSCTNSGPLYKNGSATTTYYVKILSAPSAPLVNPEPLSTLIYDFSGSSFHYNADFGTSVLYAYIPDPTQTTFSKSFSPNPGVTGGISTLTFTIGNPTPAAISSVNFTDTFPTSPAAMVVAGTPAATTSGCGAPTLTATASAGSISFVNGTIAANGTCTISVNVTAPLAGSYQNGINPNPLVHLYVGATDTTKTASATLIMGSGIKPLCVPTQQAAIWSLENVAAATNPTSVAASYTYPGQVATPPTTATFAAATGGSHQILATGGNPTHYWSGIGPWPVASACPAVSSLAAPYFQFTLDTSQFSGNTMTISFDYQMASGNDWGGTNNVCVYSQADGGTFSGPTTISATKGTTWQVGVSATGTPGTSTTTFRIIGTGAKTNNTATATFSLDNITFTGCRDNLTPPSAPTITKSFSPATVAVGGTSTLNFVVTNPNATTTLTNIQFTDTLPAGVTVATGSSAQCGGTLTTTTPSTISVTIPSRAGGLGTCTIPVTVTATTSGPHNNVSGYISSTESGTNSGATGTASATLTALIPPTIAKSFDATTIPTGTGTSVLTFTITNPNLSGTLTGVAFTDTLPLGLTIASSSTTQCSGTLTATHNTSPTQDVIVLAGGSILASSSCTLTVTVTGAVGSLAPGTTYTNTTGAVTSTNGGTGNTATAQIVVRTAAPKISVLKQVSTSNAGPWVSTIGVAVNTLLWYQVTIENTGDVQLNNVGASDPNVSMTGCSFTTTLPAASGNNTTTTTCVIGSISAVSGSHPNTVTAQGTNGSTVTATSTATYDTTGLSIVKSVTESYFSGLPEVLHYSFQVTNTGYYPLVGPVTITDPTPNVDLGSINCPAVTTLHALNNYLEPGDVLTCTATHTIVSGDLSAGSVSNTATNSSAGGVSSGGSNTVNTPAKAANYGNLPVGGSCPACFPASYNVFLQGGARALTCSTFLGSSVANSLTTGPTDGTNTTTYTQTSTEDGVTFPTTGGWSIGSPPNNGGWVTVNVVCPGGTCYLSGWIDWLQQGRFSDSGDQILNNVAVTAGTQTIQFSMPSGIPTSGTWYARFRLYDSSQASPSPTGSSGCGEIEDYQLNATTLTTTPVTLAYFQAHPQGHGFHIEFSTATEAGNVGFAIYTSSGGKLVKITQQPVRSTAKDPVSPQDYVFDTTADAPSGVFYLEDLDVYGKGRMHGPFTLGRPYGRKPKPVKTDWAAIHRERDKHQKDQDAAALAAMAARGSNATRANLLVSADGVYRVTYETLLAAGFNFGGVMSKDLALFNKGGSVPIEVTGSGPTFGPGSAIQFYGNALNTIYTYNNVYTLQVDKANALGVTNDNTKPSLATPTASYMETVKVNNNLNYDLGSTSGDPWYDTTLFTWSTPVSTSFPISIDNVSSTSGASLAVDFYGYTDFPLSPDHHVIVQLNGTTVSEKVFDGVANVLVQAPLPPGLIHEGANSMTLTLPGDTGADYDMVNLDRYSITYARQFLARAGRLTFTASGTGFQVGGLPTPNVLVYRLSGSAPVRLTGAQVQRSGAGYAVSFPGNGQPATYAVTALEAAFTPTLSVPSSPNGVTTGPAQLLVISHPDFLDNLGPLVAARQAEGLSVKVVDVNDVYAQYTFGIFDPAAIKSYVKYAAANMGTQYVLLVGGDTYDYRNDLGIGAVGFIPTLYAATDNYVVYAPVDPLFGDVNGDNIPEVAVGRLPARITAEVDSMIRKTLAYASKGYAKTAMFAADEDEPGVSYKAANEAFLKSLPAGWAKQEANVGDIGGVDAARLAVINAMNSGVALVSFYGHGAPWVWTFSNLFNTDDAAALRNVGSPFFVSQLGCWNSYYVSPYYDTLAHVFLLSGDQGAAGVGGPAAMTVNTSDELFGKYLFPRLTAPGTRVGAAIVGAKKDAVGASDPTSMIDILLGYVLLCDPTLKIQP
jgi:uncharacterized repeat protein (TIGR01451 family)